MIQVCGERVLSENRMKRKRPSDQKKKQEVKDVKRVQKTRKEVREGTKIGRIRRKERGREQEKT